MKNKYYATFLVAALALLPVSCGERQEGTVPEIKVPAASQAVFTSGIKFEAGEDPSQPSAGQTIQLQFTATEEWTAEVVETKASNWLSVEPASGQAGDVTMTVSAKPNPLAEPRRATVTIKCGDKSKSFVVEQAAAQPTVVEISSVTLDRTELAMVAGDETALTATVLPGDATDRTVTWSSSNPAVASVTEAGLVTALASGTAAITATAGGKTATCTVTVTVPVSSITLDKSSVGLKQNETVQLTATVEPGDATDRAVTWTSSDTAVATVDSSGKVKALDEGVAVITARAGTITATCTVTVSNTMGGGGHEGTGTEMWD